jgi:excisionase family DNA binding protein
MQDTKKKKRELIQELEDARKRIVEIEKAELRARVRLSPKRMLTVSQAAGFLGVHANTVRTWSKMGVLKYGVIGRGKHRRFLREDLEHFLQVG